MVIKIPHWHASVTGKEKSIQLDQNWSHLWAGIHNHHLSFTWSHCITDFIHIRCGHDCISVKWARAHSWELVQALCYLQEETIPNLTKSVEIKLSIDDFWRSYTFFFFPPPFGGKTDLVSSLSCLSYSFRFPICSLWPSWVGWCNYWWKPNQENDPSDNFLPSENDPTLSCTECLRSGGTTAQHKSELLCWRPRLHFLNRHDEYTNGLLNCSLFEQACGNKWGCNDSVLCSM